MKHALISLFLFIVIIFTAFLRSQNTKYQATFETVCYLAYNKVFKPEDEISSWFYNCMNEAKKNKKYLNNNEFVAAVQAQLDRMGVNHLYVMTPSKEKYRKTGEAKSTGIVSHLVDGRLVVKKIIAGSSADKQGVKRGDIIMSVKGKDIFYPSQTFTLKGKYTFLRVVDGEDQLFTVKIKLTPVKENLKIRIIKESETAGRIVVPSFYTEVFSKDYVLAIGEELKKYKKITIDLNDNMGGHIISGLRLLSLFTCGERKIGQFIKPKMLTGPESTLPNKDDFTEEYKDLLLYSKIHLQTFAGYGCFKGRVDVVVNQETASISEIVALALQEQLGAKIKGERTSGQAVMALSYELNSLGKGYSLVIPEAIFESAKGQIIEGRGIN